MVQSRFARALLFLAVAALSGACATTRYTQSRIAPGTSDRTATQACFRVEGLKIAIETLDRAPEEAPATHLALRFHLEPEELKYHRLLARQ